MKKVKAIIQESIDVKQKLLEDETLIGDICLVNALLQKTFSSGNKLLFCGNGGSASDAQHLAAEFSGRFKLDRESLFAEALHVNSSALTAIANDFGFDQVYSKMIESKGKPEDTLIAISTSGNSANIVNACKKAKDSGLKIVGFTGAAVGSMDEFCDILIKIPSTDTARIQEAHILVGHIICEIVELKLFNPK